MPRASLSEWSNRVRLLESQHKLSGRVRFSPFYYFVETIFPIAIIIGTWCLVEVEVDQIVVGNSLLSYELIQSFQALHLDMFEVSFWGNPWTELFSKGDSIIIKYWTWFVNIESVLLSIPGCHTSVHCILYQTDMTNCTCSWNIIKVLTSQVFVLPLLFFSQRCLWWAVPGSWPVVDTKSPLVSWLLWFPRSVQSY